MNNITINTQSSIKIKTKTGNLYFDPYLINEESHDAMIIFITHEHYCHPLYTNSQHYLLYLNQLENNFLKI